VTAGELIQDLRTTLRAGESAKALRQALSLVHSGKPEVRADALLIRVAAIINLGQRRLMRSALDDAADAVRADPAPERYASLYASAAIIANLEGSFEACVDHLIRSAHALAAVSRVDEQIAYTWHDLALAYSSIGFHGYALGALERARSAAVEAGCGEGDYITPTIRIRLAVRHDHLGDSEACLRVLRDVVDELPRHQEIQRKAERPMKTASQVAYGYAVARLATLGAPVGVDPRPLLTGPGDSQRIRDFRHLADVCLRIAGGRAEDALRRLSGTPVAAATVGPAEPQRLRALAHLTAGRPADAYAEDRRAFRLAIAQDERIREHFIESRAARLWHDDLQRRLARFEGEAVTDPLTGLPNRRFLEQEVQELIDKGEYAVVAVCDLDGFKQVNDVHGHITGDLVLQRVATILSRLVRREDVVARYGGDEFVVVMPRTRPPEGEDVAQRIAHAVKGEDWASIAPGTPIGVTVGWAFADGQGALRDAFAAADRAMLRAKPPSERRRAAAHPVTGLSMAIRHEKAS
jgi:diguanylate cyclase (GGDEF)-like protein